MATATKEPKKKTAIGEALPAVRGAASLFEMTEEAKEVRDAIEASVDPETGEIRDHALIERLDDLKGAIERKATAVGFVVLRIRDAIGLHKSEEMRLRGRRQGAERLEERLKEYLLRCLAAAGVKKAEHGTVTVSRKVARGRVVVEDEASVPIEFKRVVLTMGGDIYRSVVEPALRAAGTFEVGVTEELLLEPIRKAIEEGKAIPGAFVQPGEAVTIS